MRSLLTFSPMLEGSVKHILVKAGMTISAMESFLFHFKVILFSLIPSIVLNDSVIERFKDHKRSH